MAVKPTREWRDGVAEEAHQLAAGTLAPENAFMARLFPEPMLRATEAVLASFETDTAQLAGATDERIFAIIERVVLALNDVNERFDDPAYETAEREALCAYIDETLTERGVDVPALAARRGIGAHEITDAWRDW